MLWLFGLALILAAFGSVAFLLVPRVSAVTATPPTAHEKTATEALVGRPPLNPPAARAPLPAVSSREHAVPFSIAEAPTFTLRPAQADGADAGLVHSPPLASAGKTTRGTKGLTEEELRTAMRRVSVTMYSTDWCPVCKRARSWLLANGISFEELDVDRNESARRRQLSLNPKGGVPTIDVDGEVMIGFGPEHMQEILRRAAERRARKF
jgi:glutaredoxin